MPEIKSCDRHGEYATTDCPRCLYESYEARRRAQERLHSPVVFDHTPLLWEIVSRLIHR